jgi:hypothetical protein
MRAHCDSLFTYIKRTNCTFTSGPSCIHSDSDVLALRGMQDRHAMSRVSLMYHLSLPHEYRSAANLASIMRNTLFRNIGCLAVSVCLVLRCFFELLRTVYIKFVVVSFRFACGTTVSRREMLDMGLH